eukprot:SAG31_NODE_2018_length_6661_cov_2.339531_5_plen_72_part_01
MSCLLPVACPLLVCLERSLVNRPVLSCLSCSGANGLLQNHLARETYGFDGFFTTDCGALPFTNQDHYMSSSP